MMNDCLKYTISPTAQYACLYSISSELGASAGKLVLNAGFGLFCNVKNISYISGMIKYYTYKITNTDGEIVYVGYSKIPWHREKAHFSKRGKFYDTSYKFQCLGEYPNEVMARYYEEKLKREIGLKGEMGDEHFKNYKKLFKFWWR